MHATKFSMKKWFDFFYCVQKSLAYNFLWVTTFNGFEIITLRLMIPIFNFSNKIFLLSANFEAKRGKPPYCLKGQSR
jgi:hypothetical protein